MSPLVRHGNTMSLWVLICAAAVCCAAEYADSSGDVSPALDPSANVHTAVEKAIGPLVAKLDDLTTQVTDLTTQVTGLKTQVTDLTVRLEGQSVSLDSVKSRLEQVERFHTGPPFRDCSDLPTGARSGVYQLQLNPFRPPVTTYCDMTTDGGNWTVIQRRGDYLPRQDFFLDWAAYKAGFGDIRKEFWWGLDNIRSLTSRPDRRYELRVDLEDGGERRYAVYQGFSISDESDGYRLAASNYSGDAGDSLTAMHVGQRFSTKDKKQDSSPYEHCADRFKGGWWYSNCHDANLNALYLAGPAPQQDGVIWQSWKGYRHSLASVEMKVRPT